MLTAKNTSEAYDSVVIESLPGYVLNPKYITWVVDKQGRSCKYIQHNVSGEGKVKNTTDIVFESKNSWMTYTSQALLRM